MSRWRPLGLSKDPGTGQWWWRLGGEAVGPFDLLAEAQAAYDKALERRGQGSQRRGNRRWGR